MMKNSLFNCVIKSGNKHILTVLGMKIEFYTSAKSSKWFYKRARLLLKILDKLLPKDKYKVIFDSYPDFADSAYLFYEFLKEKKQDKFKKIIWLKEEIESSHSKINDKIYPLYSIKGIWNLITAKYIIHDHCNEFLDFITSDRHVLFNLWHGSPIKAIGMMDDDVLPKTRRRYNYMAKHSYWFVSSDIYKVIISSMLQIDPKKIYVTGIVRTDVIFKEGKEEYIKNVFGLNGFDSIVLYAPTYKTRGAKKIDVKVNADTLFCFDKYNDDDFIKYLKGNNICLIIKPHPFEEAGFIKFLNDNNYTNLENVKIITTNDLTEKAINLNELFRVTDLIISDFSSITIDYAISKKPILYLTHYLQNYRDGRGFILPDNLKILMPGETVNNYEELINKMAICLKTKEQNYTDEELKFIYKYLDGKSCERIFEVMKEL